MVADPAPGSGSNPETLGAAERGWTSIAAVLALGLLGGTLTWWALKEGAYFGRVMYPGVALLCLGLILLLATAPKNASLKVSGFARLGIYALLGLGAWSLASALWSPTPDIAVQDAQRIIGYALFFVLGIWACALLGRRMELSMLPVVGAAGIAAVFALIALALADAPVPYLEEDGTLQYPLGYRNANAAFFLVALWPALALTGSPRVAKAIRVGAFVAASACIQVALAIAEPWLDHRRRRRRRRVRPRRPEPARGRGMACPGNRAGGIHRFRRGGAVRRRQGQWRPRVIRRRDELRRGLRPGPARGGRPRVPRRPSAGATNQDLPHDREPRPGGRRRGHRRGGGRCHRQSGHLGRRQGNRVLRRRAGPLGELEPAHPQRRLQPLGDMAGRSGREQGRPDLRRWAAAAFSSTSTASATIRGNSLETPTRSSSRC